MDGGLGIRLREAAAPGDAILAVPPEAWISVPFDSPEPEADLAWRLLTERWQGAASKYAPYVDFLWHVDLGLHPVFWTDDEVAWLKASCEAYESVLEVRHTVSSRARVLADRAAAASGGPGAASVPATLLADPARLEAELLLALVLVEARAIEVSPAVPGQPALAAMVPLLDHLRHDASGLPGVQIGDEGGPMCAIALAALAAGAELRHCYEPVSSAQLLARYGFAPEPTGNTHEDLLTANMYSSVRLPVRVSQQSFEEQGTSSFPIKLKILAERTGLDLRPGSPAASARLSLPRDLHAGGRLLPAARFLVSTVAREPGQSEEEACESLFVRIFQGVEGGTAPALDVPAPVGGEELSLEVAARATAWEWCEMLLKRYQKAFQSIARDVGVSVEAEGGGATGASAAGEGLGAERLVDEVVMAHFKAKGPGGKATKSRKAREARVLAVAGGRATVQFVSNGVRQEIPEDWLVKDSLTGAKRQSLAELLHMARGRLAIALLSVEAAMVEVGYNMTQYMVQCGTSILQARGEGKKGEEFELTDHFRAEWKREQTAMREAAQESAGEG